PPALTHSDVGTGLIPAHLQKEGVNPSPTNLGLEPEFTNEPHTDFSRAEARERMRTALATVRATPGRRIELTFPPPSGLTSPTLTPRHPARPETVAGVVRAAA